MMIIFFLSSRNATQSSEQSSVILKWLISIFNSNTLTDFIVRKLAHCLEYTGLSLLFSFAFLFSLGKKECVFPFACTSFYAITDEFHQLFVLGRSCEFRDWAIDSAGALFGIAFFLLLYFIGKKILMKKQKHCHR